MDWLNFYTLHIFIQESENKRFSNNFTLFIKLIKIGKKIEEDIGRRYF